MTTFPNPDWETYPRFRPRVIRSYGVVAGAGWRFKAYSIARNDDVDISMFDGGWRKTLASLEAKGFLPEYSTIGFIILHRAAKLYVITGRWCSFNELCVDVVVRQEQSDCWQEAGDVESFCVWDLEILWHERGSYIAHVLNGHADVDAYLGDQIGERAPQPLFTPSQNEGI